MNGADKPAACRAVTQPRPIIAGARNTPPPTPVTPEAKPATPPTNAAGAKPGDPAARTRHFATIMTAAKSRTQPVSVK